MKITFIRPHITDVRSPTAMEPLVFAILAGLTPKDIELDFFDERVEPIPTDHDTDLIALTVDTYTARRAYQIATQYRTRGIPVVMGGHHPSFLPKEALVYADAVVIGDAEGVWAQLVRDAKQGRLQEIYKDTKQPSLEKLKFDRSIFNGKDYKLVVPVQYGRGCKYSCDFCSIHAFYGFHTRQRPVAEVVSEIEALNRKYFIFI
ncbi:MAG: cobalamin-dependent protein, partial [Anaerolineales bacterium]|nr:cobalamin-dependent protein [Anaerolineales bacterium]